MTALTCHLLLVTCHLSLVTSSGIPPWGYTRKMKRIILCCDGTWNQADQAEDGTLTPTNVVNLAVRIAKCDGPTLQVTYYDQGVGTGNVIDRMVGGAMGEGLEANIHDAYRFLIANYQPGDKLYFFGFSRGAFTVRSIAGMVRKCGILDRTSVAEYPNAIALYRNRVIRPTDAAAMRFREQHSACGETDIPIHFMGVWDTVGALGIPLSLFRGWNTRKYQFHDTELSRAVKNAYHALAIDERRRPFTPALWAYKPKEGQFVKQVWFAGVHSDVGGGYADYEMGHNLALIPLVWMMDAAKNCGLAMDDAVNTTYPLPMDPLAPKHDSRRGLFNLLPGGDRTIGLTTDPTDPTGKRQINDVTQSVHESALERWDKDKLYRPDGLKEYFERQKGQ
jgi:uncharacterized protein (DUF2235 family)